MPRRPASPKTVWRRRPKKHVPDDALIDGHRLTHLPLRREGGSMITVRTECSVCCEHVEVTVWEADYASPEAAAKEVLRISRSNFEYDCEDRLLRDVMAG